MGKTLASVLCALVLLAVAPASRGADAFWLPLVDGQTFAFEQTGRVQESNGATSSWGPVRLSVHVQAVNVQLLGQQADWLLTRTGDDRFTGTYLAQTGQGLLRVSDGHPTADVVFRYYSNPQPWLYWAQMLDEGVPVSFSGQRFGRWALPGGGTQGWTGTWQETLIHRGRESVTTPLGTFDALKLEVNSLSTVDTLEAAPKAREFANWDELRWFVPGLGFVKVQGSGRYNHDFNGDGIADRWEDEVQTMFLVPEPATVWSLLGGLALLAVFFRRR